MTEIRSTANDKVKAASQLLGDASKRRAQRLAVVEGASLVCEVASRGLRIRSVFATERALRDYAEKLKTALTRAEEAYIVSDAVSNKLSSQQTPQGVCAVFELPKAAEESELMVRDRLLALCSLRDPQNVGAAIRCAAAFGFDGVLLSEDCADVFSPKALRTSMGAVFSVKLCFCADASKTIREFSNSGFLTLAAALDEGAQRLDEIDVSKEKLLIAIGNEGAGLDGAVISACKQSVIIPISDGVESLNAAVAAGVLMWHFRRKA